MNCASLLFPPLLVLDRVTVVVTAEGFRAPVRLVGISDLDHTSPGLKGMGQCVMLVRVTRNTHSCNHDQGTANDLEDVPSNEKSELPRLVRPPLSPAVVEPHARRQLQTKPGAEQGADNAEETREDGYRAGQDVSADDDQEDGAKPEDPVLDSVLGEVGGALQGSNEHPFSGKLVNELK